MSKIVIGKYLPYNSIIHNIDPRIKLISLLIILITIFFPIGYIGYFIILINLLILVILSKLNLSFVWSAIKPMIFMLIFLLIINIFTLKTGILLLSIYNIDIYSDALFQTLYITIRLVLMIISTTILTSTTKPLDLTLAIEDLLKPFKLFKVPYSEIAMRISIALRFIPTLLQESERIMKAQASRGLDLKHGNIKEKSMAILALIVPLFVSSFLKAEDLANAMEARGYIPSAYRTRIRELKITNKDIIFISITIIVVIIIGLISII